MPRFPNKKLANRAVIDNETARARYDHLEPPKYAGANVALWLLADIRLCSENVRF
jgi:hypothetical protein